MIYRLFAAKVISKRLMKGREHMVKNEIIVLKRVSQGHKNILTLVDYFETPSNLYLITDVAQGDELFDRIYNKGSFYESEAAAIIRSIVSGVAYLHKHGIVHRDLKPENLLFRTMDEDSDLLIADFGLSRIIDEEQFRMLTTTCGTPAYMAPEIFKKSGHGKPVDVWAIGVITYFLLCGYTPFDRDTSAEEMDAILKCDYSFEPEEYWVDVSQEARDFITKCLQIDVAKRMTADDCLKQPFLDLSRFSNSADSSSPSKTSSTENNGVGVSTTSDTTGSRGDNQNSVKEINEGSKSSNGKVTGEELSKPKKKESDLLPTVKSNLNLRRLTGGTPTGSLDVSSLIMSPITTASANSGTTTTTTATTLPSAPPSSSSISSAQQSHRGTAPVDIPNSRNSSSFVTLAENEIMDGAYSESPNIITIKN